jgi:hypothetical protein
MSDMREDLMESLIRQRASRKARSQALWKMSTQERVSAMRRGELTWGQLFEWARGARHEVPLIDGEFVFIAACTPEVAEAGWPQRQSRPPRALACKGVQHRATRFAPAPPCNPHSFCDSSSAPRSPSCS